MLVVVLPCDTGRTRRLACLVLKPAFLTPRACRCLDPGIMPRAAIITLAALELLAWQACCAHRLARERCRARATRLTLGTSTRFRRKGAGPTGFAGGPHCLGELVTVLPCRTSIAQPHGRRPKRCAELAFPAGYTGRVRCLLMLVVVLPCDTGRTRRLACLVLKPAFLTPLARRRI